MDWFDTDVLRTACSIPTNEMGDAQATVAYIANELGTDEESVVQAAERLHDAGLVKYRVGSKTVAPLAVGRARVDDDTIRSNAQLVLAALQRDHHPLSGQELRLRTELAVNELNWAVEYLIAEQAIVPVSPGTQGKYKFTSVVPRRLRDEPPQRLSHTGDSPLPMSGSLGEREQGRTVAPASPIVKSAIARDEAHSKIQEAIEILKAEEWTAGSREKELIEGFVISQLELIDEVLFLNLQPSEIARAKATVERAKGMLEKARDFFAARGPTVIERALTVALVEFGKAVVF